MTEHNITVVNEVADELAEEIIKKAVSAALEAEKVEQKCDVCIIITDDENIHELNLEHRNVDRPTDVLSFPMMELIPGEAMVVNPLELDESGAVMLGDIVISSDRAKAQAEEYGHSVEREISFLTVHGMLHLLGYDHELGEEEEKLHFSRQEEILNDMGIVR